MKKHLLFIFGALLLSTFVKAQCNADFTYTISANTVSVTGVTTGTGTAIYAWQWGEASSLPGSGQSTAYTYSMSGTYSLCLTYIEFAFPPCSTQVCKNIVIGTVGLSEKNNIKPYFNISPNPASSYVNIDYSLTQESSLEISLIDITGKMVDQIETGKNIEMGIYTKQYHTKNLAAGIYFIRFKSENGIQVKKLIIN